MDKTNAIRIMEETGLPFEVLLAPGGSTDAGEVADIIGLPRESVFKTLVTRGKTGAFYVFMLPASSRLDLKKAARACGEKNIEMILQKELFPLTGYVHGGCSPLGMKKKFPTFIDETCILSPYISFSAGKIGMQIKTEPMAFIEAAGITPADLAE